MKTRAVQTVIAVLAAGAAFGQGDIHEGDIAIGADGDRIGVSDGSRDMVTGELVFGACAFGVQLDSNARSTDPGFDSESGVFPSSGAIGYAYRAALREWDGAAFSTIPEERLRMSFGPVAGISTPLADPAEPIEGVFVGVSGNGEYHTHYAFRLELDGQPATGAQSLGVYLAELELRLDTGELEPSEPFWLVFSNGADSMELQDAVAYARDVIGGCGEEMCAADVNGDGLVTPGDFSAWIVAFNTGASGCDQNGDGQCLPNDFSAFVVNFNAGCP